MINNKFQILQILSFSLVFLVLKAASMELPIEHSQADFNDIEPLTSLFDQFSLDLPPLTLSSPSQTARMVANGVLTISLEQIDPYSRLLADLSREYPSIREIRVINTNPGSAITRDQLDLLGLYFHGIESLHLVGVHAPSDVLIFLNQFSNLRELNLSHNNITAEELKEVVKLLNLPKLKKLNLSHNPEIGNDGFAVLAEFAFAPHLESLDVSNSGLKLSGIPLKVFDAFEGLKQFFA